MSEDTELFVQYGTSHVVYIDTSYGRGPRNLPLISVCHLVEAAKAKLQIRQPPQEITIHLSDKDPALDPYCLLASLAGKPGNPLFVKTTAMLQQNDMASIESGLALSTLGILPADPGLHVISKKDASFGDFADLQLVGGFI